MPLYCLDGRLIFPDARQAEPDGLLALGGDLRPQRLELAYREGIFPWFTPGEEIQWWSPDPRGVLYTNRIRVTKSMKQVLGSGKFKVTTDTEFEKVITHCKTVYRPGQQGMTWIGNSMIEAYVELHHKGIAHSVEVWHEGELAGGLYGLQIGGLFCGESMFSLISNASKTAFITLARRMHELQLPIIDSQIYNPHMGSLGVEKIPRSTYLKVLVELRDLPVPSDLWSEHQGK